MGLAGLILFFIVFSSSKYAFIKVIGASNDTSYLVDLSYKSCAHNSFCNSERKPLSTGFFSCCAECSCSADCYFGNKCCPDFDDSSRHHGSCKPQSEYFDDHRNLLVPGTNYANDYYVVDTCKEGYGNESFYGCLHPSTLDEHVFVSDINSKTIFKNKKCAACNGVDQYHTWQQTILCPYNEAIVSFTERKDHILGHCRLVSEPPETLKESFNALICNPSAISECNVTGEWDYLDSEMEQACKSFNMEYRDERIVRGRVLKYRTFKNVYCYLCNTRKGTSAQPRCLTEIKRLESDKRESILPALTAVFDDRADQIITTGKCMPNEIEDHLLGVCKPIFCPFGQTAVFGTCKSDLRLLFVTLSTSYDVKIDQLAESDVSPEFIDGLLEEIGRKVQATPCILCKLIIYDKNLMSLTASTTPQCTANKLLKVLEYFSTIGFLSFHLNNRGFNVSLKESRVNLKDYAAYDDFETLPVKRLSACVRKIHLNPKFYCKRIEYYVEELINGGVPNNTIGDLVKRSVHIDARDDNDEHTRYVICMKDYVLFRNDTSSLFAWLWLLISSGLIISFS